MDERAKALVEVITHIRRAFWQLTAVSDDMLENLGLTASLRAILEHLDQEGAATVPQIARDKLVKRQSIQELVDQLRAKGLVAITENPAHRRSGLVDLTPTGKTLFRKIKAREVRVLTDVASRLNARDLKSAGATLAALRDTLTQKIGSDP